MKSHVANKIVRQELDLITDELYEKFAHGVGYQTLATAFRVLYRDFDFDAERLKTLKDAIEDEFNLMQTGVFGKDYGAMECVKWCKEIGIDFEESQFKVKK